MTEPWETTEVTSKVSDLTLSRTIVCVQPVKNVLIQALTLPVCQNVLILPVGVYGVPYQKPS